MSDVRRVLAAYLQQQADIDAPEFVMNRGFVRALRQAVAPAELSAPQPAPQPAAEAAPQRPRSSQPPSAPPPPPQELLRGDGRFVICTVLLLRHLPSLRPPLPARPSASR